MRPSTRFVAFATQAAEGRWRGNWVEMSSEGGGFYLRPQLREVLLKAAPRSDQLLFFAPLGSRKREVESESTSAAPVPVLGTKPTPPHPLILSARRGAVRLKTRDSHVSAVQL